MSKIRAIKYDPKTKIYSEEVITNYKDYSKLLECRTFDVIMPTSDMSIYIDDEGLFVEGNEVTQIQLTDGRTTQLAGILVFTGGVDRDGETLGFNGEIEELKTLVQETDLVVGYEE